MDDKNRGLYRKYLVQRLNDLNGTHAECQYFVFDLDHDQHAIPALRAYAASVRDECPLLAANLEEICDKKENQQK